VLGGTDANGVAVGTAVHAGTTAAAINFFPNPVAVFDNVRPLILGLDSRSGGAGTISGLPSFNLDLSAKKRLVIHERYSVEVSGVFQNALNHLSFSNPSLSLQSTNSWGVIKTQGNTPRQIQFGIRTNF
jgi:hypothetical protein